MAYVEKYANFDLGTGANDGSTEADAWRTPTAVNSGVAAGNRVNIKRQAAAYNLTATFTFNVNGTLTSPIYYRAYTTTIGDNGIWECAYNSGSTANLIFSGNYSKVEGIWFKPGAAQNSNTCNVNGVSSWAIRCKIEANGTVTIANAYRCWVSIAAAGGGGAHVVVAGANVTNNIWRDCFIKRTGATTSVRLLFNDLFDRHFCMDNCVLWGNNNASENLLELNRLSSSRGVYISGNRFYNGNHAIWFDTSIAAAKKESFIVRNLFDTMAGRGIFLSAGSDGGYMYIQDNLYRSLTSGLTNLAVDENQLGNVALTASPFVNTTGDFAMNSTAGGGQVARDAEFAMDPTDSASMKVEPHGQWWLEAVASGGGGASFAVLGG